MKLALCSDLHLRMIFLDFDGVLHDHDVVVDKTHDGKRFPVMRGLGELMQWVQHLEALIAPYPALQIDLSTKWVRWFGIDFCRAALPGSLATRVVGATWEGSWAIPEGWIHWTRQKQVQHHAEIYGIERWLALDDDDRGLAGDERERLVITAPSLGISDPLAQEQLQTRLATP